MNFMKKNDSSTNPIKVFPKPSVALTKCVQRGASREGVTSVCNEIWDACDLLGEGAADAKKAVCRAAIEALYLEADRQGLNLVEVDKAIGLATFR